MQAHELKPGDRVEIVMTVTVASTEHYDHTGPGDQGPGFTAVGFNEFTLDHPILPDRDTNYFTLELPDNVEHTITKI